MNSQLKRIYAVRTGLVLAVLFFLIVFSLNMIKLKNKMDRTYAALQQQTTARQSAESQLKHSLTSLQETAKVLATAQQELVEVKADALRERQQADEKRAAYAALAKHHDQTKVELARYEAIDLTPEEMVRVSAEVKKLRVRLANAEKKVAALDEEINSQKRWTSNADEVPLPAGLKTTVVLYDPKWRFVVLDVGSEQGMVKNAELLVSRHGRLVSKIKISTTEKGRSIGNVVAGWQLSDIFEGDIAIPVHPRS
jgi:hypothetical protein